MSNKWIKNRTWWIWMNFTFTFWLIDYEVLGEEGQKWRVQETSHSAWGEYSKIVTLIRPGPPYPNPRKGQVVYPPTPGHQTWEPPLLVTSGGDHWRAVQTCSFGDPMEWRLVVATETEARTVSKWAVCILLECFQRFVDFHFKVTKSWAIYPSN